MSAINKEISNFKTYAFHENNFKIVSKDDFLDIVNINLKSVFLSSQEAARFMASFGGGSIINISSIGGIVPDVSQVAYGTSKAAINYLTKLIASQGVPKQYI